VRIELRAYALPRCWPENRRFRIQNRPHAANGPTYFSSFEEDYGRSKCLGRRVLGGPVERDSVCCPRAWADSPVGVLVGVLGTSGSVIACALDRGAPTPTVRKDSRALRDSMIATSRFSSSSRVRSGVPVEGRAVFTVALSHRDPVRRKPGATALHGVK
jgi:hypothetical protein